MRRRTLLGYLAAGSVGAIAGCGTREKRQDSPTPTETERSRPEPEESEWEKRQEQFGFDERVDAVEDLGWDPSGTRPVNASLVESFERDALIEVPPGTYKLADSVTAEKLSNWGLVGLGEKRTDVTFTTNEGSRIEFKVLHGKDILLENFAFDQGDQFDRTLGMTFFIDDNLRIYNVEKAGSNPTLDPSGVSALALNVVNPDGSAVVDTFARTGPQAFLRYPKNELCVFSGTGHMGTITYRNLHIENAGENGIYASKCPGEVHVEGGFYRNNRNDNIRISGTGSYIRGATVVIDSDDFHPRNRGTKGNMRGIRMQSGDQGYTGGVIEDTRLELHSTFRTQSLVHIAHNQGGMTMRNSELQNWTNFFSFRAKSPSEHVAKPWSVNLENVRLVEHGQDGSALKIGGRPNSILRNVTLETTQEAGKRNGIILADSEGTVFENVKIATNGIPLEIERPSNPLKHHPITFRGDNEFSMRHTQFVNSPVDTSNNRSIDLSDDRAVDNDRTVFPFSDAPADVDSILVTRVDDNSMEFQYV